MKKSNSTTVRAKATPTKSTAPKKLTAKAKKAAAAEKELKQKLQEAQLSTLLSEVQARGYYVARTPSQVRGRIIKTNIHRWSNGGFSFGVVSCTHLGSKYQQLTALYQYYALCESLGVDTVFHCGDMFEGEKMYRGQEYEIFAHGADAQVTYGSDAYPRRKGIKTKLISGNHDLSFWKHAGVKACKAIAKNRDDIDYLGDDLAFVDVGNIRIGLMHAEGGVAYARSYKLQKIVEQLTSEHKPHFLFVGHWHVAAMIPGYRNVETVSMGAFQSQTPYLVTKGLMPWVGGLIVNVIPDKQGIASVNYQWVPFYVPKENDF